MRAIPGGLASVRPAEESPTEHDGKAPFSSVASLNLGPESGDLEGNLRMAGEEILRAKKEEPSIRWFVLPELFTSGYSDLGSISRHAEDAERGMSVWRFAALAHELDVFIVYGPDGSRVSEGSGVAVVVAHLDPSLPTWWRTFYGDTLREDPVEALEEACS